MRWSDGKEEGTRGDDNRARAAVAGGRGRGQLTVPLSTWAPRLVGSQARFSLTDALPALGAS